MSRKYGVTSSTQLQGMNWNIFLSRQKPTEKAQGWAFCFAAFKSMEELNRVHSPKGNRGASSKESSLLLTARGSSSILQAEAEAGSWAPIHQAKIPPTPPHPTHPFHRASGI